MGVTGRVDLNTGALLGAPTEGVTAPLVALNLTVPPLPLHLSNVAVATLIGFAAWMAHAGPRACYRLLAPRTRARAISLSPAAHTDASQLAAARSRPSALTPSKRIPNQVYVSHLDSLFASLLEFVHLAKMLFRLFGNLSRTSI